MRYNINITIPLSTESLPCQLTVQVRAAAAQSARLAVSVPQQDGENHGVHGERLLLLLHGDGVPGLQPELHSQTTEG